MSDASVTYTMTEVQSVLPSGWSLGGEPKRPELDGKGRVAAWAIKVQDVADVDWDLQVKAEAVSRLGRMEALKQAMDKLYREALG